MLTRRGGKVAEFRIFNDTFELEVRFGIECNGVNPCIAVFYAGEVNLSGKGLGSVPSMIYSFSDWQAAVSSVHNKR